jgi:hypothetical protein
MLKFHMTTKPIRKELTELNTPGFGELWWGGTFLGQPANLRRNPFHIFPGSEIGVAPQFIEHEQPSVSVI